MSRWHNYYPANHAFFCTYSVRDWSPKLDAWAVAIIYEEWEKARAALNVSVLAYCVMPNHWHLLLWPSADGQLPAFMHWLTVTHVRRWHAHRHTEGRGHLYQGTYKSFPVQDDGHFLVVARYVERNALRANLVQRAQDWRWSSLWAMEHGQAQHRGLLQPVAGGSAHRLARAAQHAADDCGIGGGA